MTISPVVVIGIIGGLFGFVASSFLFVRYRRSGNKAALALAICVFVYGFGYFLWAIEDFSGVTLPMVVLLAYISNYLPAYFGLLFVAFTLKRHQTIMLLTGSLIMAVGILIFIFYPLEAVVKSGGYTAYYLNSEAKTRLLPVVVMALSLPLLLLAYGVRMKKRSDTKEIKKGFLLSFGFLLMVLGEFILVPYLRIPILLDQIILLIGFFIIYVVFSWPERGVHWAYK